MNDSPSQIYGNSVISIREEPSKTLSFTDSSGKEIGRLCWEDKLVFEGNAEESAKVFIKFLKELWGLNGL